MTSRIYLVVVLVVVLLIWGPIDHSWPAWLAIRTGYLVAIPVGAWFLLAWIWRAWQPDEAAETRFGRALRSATAGVFASIAMLEATAETHILTNEWSDDFEVMPGLRFRRLLLNVFANPANKGVFALKSLKQSAS